jgi:hypothetical protein
MSNRFHDDPARKKQTEISSFQCKYFLETPGPGMNPAFCEDPFIRLQSWGANLQTDTVNLESDFRGLTRKLSETTLRRTSTSRTSR